MSEQFTINDLETRLTELKSQYVRTSKKLQDIEANMKAVERTICLLRGSSGRTAADSTTDGRKKRVMEQVVTAVMSISGEFDVSTIYDWIKQHPTDDPIERSSIYEAISDLEQGGEIRKTIQAAGRRPAKYAVGQPPRKEGSPDETA